MGFDEQGGIKGLVR